VRWLRKFAAAGGEHVRSAAEKSPAAVCSLGLQRGLASWFACFVPFGAATAEQWSALVTLAEAAGASGLRITHERSLLLLDIAEDASLLARVAELGFVVSAEDPRVHAIACPGAPACASACGETRELAADLAGALAPLLTKDARFHVSGCSKGCAWNGRADVTLVHAADGVRLALDASVAEAESTPLLSLAEVRERLSLLHLTAQAACAHEKSETICP
jgi:precorrin-3B synthase